MRKAEEGRRSCLCATSSCSRWTTSSTTRRRRRRYTRCLSSPPPRRACFRLEGAEGVHAVREYEAAQKEAAARRVKKEVVDLDSE
jgi:hypothetical protein